MSRYVSLSVYVDTNMKTNWRGDSWNVQINAGGAAVQINNPSCDWSVPQVCYWTTYSSTRVLTFTASSGITNLITTLTSSVGGNARGHIGMSNLVLYGRTVTG